MMRIKDVGRCLVFVVLIWSVMGMTLEDKKVIQGILSSFDINSASEDSDDYLVEVLALSCRLELLHVNQIYKDLGFGDLDASGARTGKVVTSQAVAENNVREALTVLEPQKKKNLLKCFRENYLISPISGEETSLVSWFHRNLDSLLQKLKSNADSRRLLAEAHPPAPGPGLALALAPAYAPSPWSSGTKPSGSNRKAPPPVDKSVIPVPKSPPSKNRGGDSVADSSADNNNEDHNETTIIVAVVVTAFVTFFAALVLFCCCRKAFGGGSKLKHKDDRPLLSLSMTDSASGSSPKVWGVENSVHKAKMENQYYMGNLGSAAGDNLSMESANNVSASAAATNVSNGWGNGHALKPPPGRTRVPAPGLPPLRPPPGRAKPLPPERPASMRQTPSAGGPSLYGRAERLPPERPASMSQTPNAGGPPPPPPEPPEPSAAAPPPPPPPKKAGPPPPGPPPPPPPRGGKPGPKVPPPPKGGNTSARPPPAAIKTSNNSANGNDAAKAKLKPFFWDKVQANPEHSMVWDQLKSGSFQFNEEMIESLFGYAAADNKKKESSSRDPPPQFIQLIDQKKAQNLSILLRALNVTTEEVRDALLEGNELPSELLETLLKMAPTPEEELKLRLFNGEISQLGPAERFLKALADIPHAFKRLESLLLMGTLQDEATTIKESFIILEAACKELRNSRLFLKLLEAVLKTGNRMNDGTYRGGAQAFRLDTLLKLADVKGTDGKTTLLHFVVQEIIRSEGVRAVRAARESKSISSIKSDDLLEDVTDDSEEHYRSLGLQVVSGVGDQLDNVKKAACLDSDSFTGTLAKLGNALLKAKHFLNKEMTEVGEDNAFHRALKSFVEHSEGDIMKLLEEEKRIMALVKSTADYFHGSSGKEEGLRLFVIVRDFLIMLDKACREVKERPWWPTRNQKKQEPLTRQTSTETPKTPCSPDFRQKLFPAIVERRMDSGSSDDDD